MFWPTQKIQQNTVDLEKLDYEALPRLNAEALIQVLGQFNRIRSIQRIVSIDAERFDLLYLGPIKQFCELAQLAPASTDYHHTSPGGLIVHTLAMVEYSLHHRRKFSLPLRSDPEVQQREKHAWTYAVFAGALLHDIGKLITLCQFRTGETIHSPFDVRSLQNCDSYSIDFVKSSSPYKLHQSLSMSFFHIFPPLGQAFIAKHLKILEELTGYFGDDPHAWGTIGEIVRQSDSQSVAENLKLSNQKRLPNAPSSPLHERLIISLRQIIRNGELPVNRSGAAIWTKGGISYLVSKTGIDAMRNFLRDHGATDIPQDNLRLFDTLQQFDLVHSTPEGRAIFRIQVVMLDKSNQETFKQTFTVLKFDTIRIFHPNKLPADLQGAIHEQEASTTDLEQISNTGESAVNQQTQKQAQAENNTRGYQDQLNKLSDAKIPVEHAISGAGIPPAENQTGAESHQSSENKTSGAGVPSSKDEVPETEYLPTKPSKELGTEFISWLREGVESKKIRLNEDSHVHILNYKGRDGETRKVAGIVSPSAFMAFAKLKGIQAEPAKKGQKTEQPYEIVQKSVHKLKIAIKNGAFHVHKYRIKNAPSPKVMLTFYAFEMEYIVPEGIQTSANNSLVFTR